jgi:choline dehydrogenase-like flavoprotein
MPGNSRIPVAQALLPVSSSLNAFGLTATIGGATSAPQVITSGRRRVYDAVIVGSGATGGWAAKQLAEAGLNVALLEAGPMLRPEHDSSEHAIPYQVKYRGFSPEITRTRPIQARCYACSEYNYKWFVNDFENPYTTPPGQPFNWFRLRVLGGRSLDW